MATEYEELKLSVTLDDQATGKLEQIKKAGRGVGDDTKQVEGLNKALVKTGETHKDLTRATEGHTEQVLKLGEALSGAHEVALRANLSLSSVVSTAGGIDRSFKTIASSVGTVGLAIGGLAIGMVAAIAIGERFAKMLSAYAQTTVERQRAAAAIGIPTAQVRLYEQAYEEHGFTKEQAREDLAGAAEKAHELRKTGFDEFRASLTRGQPTAERMQAANAAVERLTAASYQGTPAYIRESVAQAQAGGEQRRRELAGSGLSQEAIAEEVAHTINTMLVGLTGSTRYGMIGNVGTASPDDIKRQEKADKDAQDHYIAMNKIWVAYGTATDKLSESLTTVALRVLGPLSQSFKTWADSLKQEDFDRFADTLNSIVSAVAAIDWKPLLDTLKETAKEFQAIIAALDALRPKQVGEQGGYDEAPHLPGGPHAFQHFTLSQIAALDPSGGIAAQAGALIDRGRQPVTAGAEPAATFLGPHEAGVDEPAPRGYEPPTKQDYTLPHWPEPIQQLWQGLTREPTAEEYRNEWFHWGRKPPAAAAPTGEAAPAGEAAPTEALPSLADTIQRTQDIQQKYTRGPGMIGPGLLGTMLNYLGTSFVGAAHADETTTPPGPPAPLSYPQKSSYLDFAAPIPDFTIDRAALYRDARAEMTHKVEGSASLTVDVNAPPGTSVSADTDDFFHPTTINRQMQMERAETSAYRRSNIGPT